MTLSDEARDRLADVVELQPTKNAELQDRWDMESGSEVHSYLEGPLEEYYYRDDNSLIRATDEAASLVDVEPGIEGGDDGPTKIRVPPLQAAILEVLPGSAERSASVVSVLHDVRETDPELDPGSEEVRSALRSLRQKGVVAVEQRSVPTYRLALEPDELTVEETA